MDKQLRLIAGAIVIESKLSKGAKLQLLNFIQNEATDIQIKALLLDGEILTNIDEQTKEIINVRFGNYIDGKNLDEKIKEIKSKFDSKK